MSNDIRRPHTEMMQIANEMVELLAPHCEWIEVAGSLRRGKEMVGDVEIVAIPKPSFLDFTDKLLAQGVIGKFMYSNDSYRWGDRYRGISWQNTKCEVFLCDEWNRGYIQWLRTGPGDGNTLVVTRIKHRAAPFRVENGYVWNGYDKLYINTEQQWFDLLGIPYMQPQERTEEAYAKLMGAGHKWGAVPHVCVVYTASASSDPDALRFEDSVFMADADGDLFDYLGLLRERYKANPEAFNSLLRRKRLVLVSDDAVRLRHRDMALYTALDVLEKIAATQKITVVRGGELTVKPEQLSMF